MTAKSKKITATKSAAVTSFPNARDLFGASTTPMSGFNDETLKTIALLSSAILFAAPAFATQANPQNILALGDLMFKYAKGEIKVSQPSETVANPASNTTVFG